MIVLCLDVRSQSLKRRCSEGRRRDTPPGSLQPNTGKFASVQRPRQTVSEQRNPSLASRSLPVLAAVKFNSTVQVPISDVASLLGLSEEAVLEMLEPCRAPIRQDFFSIGELANRWRCSRGTVYNRLRSAGAKVLDFAAPGKKGKKAVSAEVVFRIEAKKTKQLC